MQLNFIQEERMCYNIESMVFLVFVHLMTKFRILFQFKYYFGLLNLKQIDFLEHIVIILVMFLPV